MLKIAHRTLLVLVIMLGVGMTFGCNPGGSGQTPAVRTEAQPSVIVETLDPTLQVYAPLWQAEIGRRFDNAVAILCHGGDFVRGSWIAGTELQNGHVERMQDVVRRFQKLYPNRQIVLLACNTGHLDLGVPGVYYAKSSVWCVPDRSVASPGIAAADVLKLIGHPSGEWGMDQVMRENRPTLADRWQMEPDAVGNIFEFVCDK